MRRTCTHISFHRVIALLILAAVLPLSGCAKVKGLLHRLLHHGSTAAAASPTPGSAPAPAAGVAPAVATTSVATPTPQALTETAPPPPRAPAINKSASVIVLLYHRFEPTLPKNAAARELVITPTEFDKEMQGIKDAGFTVIPMQDFIAWRQGAKNIPAKSCVITVDDGYSSGYDTAWPILKKYGYPFTMFVYIDYINSGGKSISWDQLNEMLEAGVDIESHTYSHSHLTSPGFGVDATTKARVMKDVASLGRDGWLHKEIVDSKKILEQKLGIKVDAFAYPYGTGSNDPHIRQVVKEAGYDVAFNVYGRRNGFSYPPYDQIGRYAVGGDNAAKIFDGAMKMVGGGDVGGGVNDQPAFAELASASMVTEPVEGSTINNTTPVIKANLATMGAVDPASIKMRISGVGAVTAKFDPKTKIVSYTIPTPLAKDSYTVILSATIDGKLAETRWTFNVDPNAKPSSPDMSVPMGTP
jgi:peptidoglycan/xylan/chitin deacetylase (PgdA/CDA1 family)